MVVILLKKYIVLGYACVCMGSRSWILLSVVIIVSLFGFFYLTQSPEDEARENLEWLEVGVEATYVQIAILSPGVLDGYQATIKWRIADVGLESFSVEYTDERGTGLTTVELDGVGNPYVCLLQIMPGESENFRAVEKTILFENFGVLRVYDTILETETTFWSGIYEADTGILLELDVRGKEVYEDGDVMGLFTQLQSINVEFDTN